MLFTIIWLIGTLALLVKKPEWLLLVFFTLTISAVNFDLPFGNIRYRPLLAVMLFARSFLDDRINVFDFFQHSGFKWIILFFLYIILLSWGKDTLQPEVFRLLLLSVMTAYLGYYAFCIYNHSTIVEIAIVLAGLICFSDLMYTYKVIGNFPVQRVYYLLFPNTTVMEEQNDTNHNFYGFICGIGFVMLFARYVWGGSIWGRWSFLFMPLLLLGVLMSTSRSSLLGLIFAAASILVIGARNPETQKKVYATLGMMSMLIGIMLFLFITLQSFLDLDNHFLSNITFRLVEEPVAVIRKNLGLSYNVQDLDAMDWRKESASLAWEAYTRLSVPEQLTGVGIGGYLQRNLGQNGLNPHNGLLYILLESGLIGFLLYSFLFAIAVRSGLVKGVSPLLLVLIFILFYSLGQNEELISATAMLFISTLFSSTQSKYSIYGRETV